jgi:hypothetical protein
MIELFCLWIKATNCVGMLIYEANFVPQISALIHNRKGFPLSSFNVNLLNIWRETTAEATTEHNDLIRLRTEASTVAERELEFDLKGLPVSILNRIFFNGIETVLAIIPSKGINEFIIDHCGRKGTFWDIHRLEETPFILLHVVHFARVEEHVLNAVVPAHHVNVVVTDDGSVLLSHLWHGFFLLEVHFLIKKLVNSGTGATSCDKGITVG